MSKWRHQQQKRLVWRYKYWHIPVSKSHPSNQIFSTKLEMSLYTAGRISFLFGHQVYSYFPRVSQGACAVVIAVWVSGPDPAQASKCKHAAHAPSARERKKQELSISTMHTSAQRAVTFSAEISLESQWTLSIFSSCNIPQLFLYIRCMWNVA